MQRATVIISGDDDLLARGVASALQAQGIPILCIPPRALGQLLVSLQDDLFVVAGRPVGGILFRASPETRFSDGFVADDLQFCDAEVRATWLAACHLSSIVAVNRYDAVAWFEGMGWTAWRRRMMADHIPVSPFTFGSARGEHLAAWYPYTNDATQAAPDPVTRRVLGSALTSRHRRQASLVVCNDVVRGPSYPTVQATAVLLGCAGIQIAEIATDDDEAVLSVNTQPVFTADECLSRSIMDLVNVYATHLHHW